MRELLFRGFHPCDGPDTIVVDGKQVKGRWVEGYLWSKRTIGVTSPCGHLDEVVVLPSTPLRLSIRSMLQSSGICVHGCGKHLEIKSIT